MPRDMNHRATRPPRLSASMGSSSATDASRQRPCAASSAVRSCAALPRGLSSWPVPARKTAPGRRHNRHSRRRQRGKPHHSADRPPDAGKPAGTGPPPVSRSGSLAGAGGAVNAGSVSGRWHQGQRARLSSTGPPHVGQIMCSPHPERMIRHGNTRGTHHSPRPRPALRARASAWRTAGSATGRGQPTDG